MPSSARLRNASRPIQPGSAYRRDADRERCQGKLKRALAGAAISGFSAVEIARLRPDEIAMLREEVSNRMGKLTAKERAAFTPNSWLALLSFTFRNNWRLSPVCLRHERDR